MKLRRALLALIFFLIIGAAYAAPDNCPGKDELPVTAFGRAQPIKRNLPTDTGKLSFSEPVFAFKWARVSLNADSPPDDYWILSVRDSMGRLLESFGPGSLNGSLAWTRRLYFDNPDVIGLSFELERISAAGSISIHDLVGLPSNTQNMSTYYSRQNKAKDGWKKWPNIPPIKLSTDLDWLPKAADNTGLLVVAQDREPAVPCSAIAFPGGILLTNWHCGRYPVGRGDDKRYPIDQYWKEPEVCGSSIVDLSFDGDRMSRESACSELLATSRLLDYALFTTKSIDHHSVIRPVSYAKVSATADAIVIVHHPLGDIKSVTYETGTRQPCKILERAHENWVDPAKNTDFTYSCDTEGGSSGAPVFRVDGVLLGMHHLGFQLNGQEGPDAAECDNVNKAIWFEYIVEDLRSRLQDNDESITAAARPLIEKWLGDLNEVD